MATHPGKLAPPTPTAARAPTQTSTTSDPFALLRQHHTQEHLQQHLTALTMAGMTNPNDLTTSSSTTTSYAVFPNMNVNSAMMPASHQQHQQQQHQQQQHQQQQMQPSATSNQANIMMMPGAGGGVNSMFYSYMPTQQAGSRTAISNGNGVGNGNGGGNAGGAQQPANQLYYVPQMQPSAMGFPPAMGMGQVGTQADMALPASAGMHPSLMAPWVMAQQAAAVQAAGNPAMHMFKNAQIPMGMGMSMGNMGMGMGVGMVGLPPAAALLGGDLSKFGQAMDGFGMDGMGMGMAMGMNAGKGKERRKARTTMATSISAGAGDDDVDSIAPDAPMQEARVGQWTKTEHNRFLRGLEMFGRGHWSRISGIVKTRTTEQVRTHAQKFYYKVDRRRRGRGRRVKTGMDLPEHLLVGPDLDEEDEKVERRGGKGKSSGARASSSRSRGKSSKKRRRRSSSSSSSDEDGELDSDMLDDDEDDDDDDEDDDDEDDYGRSRRKRGSGNKAKTRRSKAKVEQQAREENDDDNNEEEEEEEEDAAWDGSGETESEKSRKPNERPSSGVASSSEDKLSDNVAGNLNGAAADTNKNGDGDASHGDGGNNDNAESGLTQAVV